MARTFYSDVWEILVLRNYSPKCLHFFRLSENLFWKPQSSLLKTVQNEFLPVYIFQISASTSPPPSQKNYDFPEFFLNVGYHPENQDFSDFEEISRIVRIIFRNSDFSNFGGVSTFFHFNLETILIFRHSDFLRIPYYNSKKLCTLKLLKVL